MKRKRHIRMSRGGGGIPVPQPSGGAVTFAESPKDDWVALSGGNLTATSLHTAQSGIITEQGGYKARSTTSHSTGVVYCEFLSVVNDAIDFLIGFCTPAFDVTDHDGGNCLGANATSWGFDNFQSIYDFDIPDGYLDIGLAWDQGVVVRAKLPPTTRLDGLANGVISVILAGLGGPYIADWIEGKTGADMAPGVYIVSFALAATWPWIATIGKNALESWLVSRSSKS